MFEPFRAQGLQRAEVKDAEAALQLPTNQVLALFNKVSLVHGVRISLGSWTCSW